MKKKTFILALTACAMLLTSCIGGGALPASERARAEAVKNLPKYQTLGGVTGRSGDYTFCFKVEDAASIPLAVSVSGDMATVSMTIKFTRTDEEVKSSAKLNPFWATIHGRDAQDDVEFRLDSDAASMARVKAVLDKPGQSAEVTFTGKLPKADLDRINNTKVWTSILM